MNPAFNFLKKANRKFQSTARVLRGFYKSLSGVQLIQNTSFSTQTTNQLTI